MTETEQTETEQTEARSHAGFFSLEAMTRVTRLDVWRSLFSAGLDLLFPPRCAHCGKVDTRFCDVCFADLQRMPLTIRRTEQAPLDALLSSGLHTGILQSAVQAIKYYHTRRLAPLLADRLVRVLQRQTWTFDSVLPVPMHTRRLEERKYNQAEDISQALALQLGYPHIPSALQRVQATRSQVGLTRSERLENVAGAFVGEPDVLTGKRVLLVDDVRTTGATIATCARAVLDAGADAVYGLTVTAAD